MQSIVQPLDLGPFPLPFSVRYLEIESSMSQSNCEVHIAARLILGSAAALS